MKTYHLLTGTGYQFASKRPGCKFLCGLVAAQGIGYRFTTWYLENNGADEGGCIQWCRKCVDSPRLALHELAATALEGPGWTNYTFCKACSNLTPGGADGRCKYCYVKKSV